jgi:hypothetical protein
MTTKEELLQQKLDHAQRIRETLEEQKKVLAHYEQRYPHAPQFAQERRQSVRISRHHLEDAILEIQKLKGGNV